MCLSWGKNEDWWDKIVVLGLDALNKDIIIIDELGCTLFRRPCDTALRITMPKWRINPVDVVYIGDNPSKDFQA